MALRKNAYLLIPWGWFVVCLAAWRGWHVDYSSTMLPMAAATLAAQALLQRRFR